MKQAGKNLIEEMRKYNKELEKHIPSIDTASFDTNSLFTSESGENNELFTLFAQNLVDLRTEMNILRKNLSTDIEAMVTRVVNEQQKRFNARMDNFFVKAILDVKESWAAQISEFSQDLTEVKRCFNQMKTESSNLHDSIENMKEEFLVLKSSIKELGKKEENSTVVAQVKYLDSRLEVMKKEMQADFTSQLSKISKKVGHLDEELGEKGVIENKLNTLSESYDSLSKRILELKKRTENIDASVKQNTKDDFLDDIRKALENEFDPKFKELSGSYSTLMSELDVLKKMALQTNTISSGPSFQNQVKKIQTSDSKSKDEPVEILERKESAMATSLKSPSQKIIDIDARISKLSSFK